MPLDAERTTERNTDENAPGAQGGEADSQSKKALSRRQFLLAAWGAAGVVASAELAGITLRFLAPRDGEGALGGKITAGKVADFPVGTATYIRQGRFFLVRLKRSFLALYQVCTHLACVVVWNDEEGRFECPCHGAVFNDKGEVLAGPAPRPLDYFPVEIVNDNVIVDTSALTQRAEFDQSQATEV